MFFQQKTQSYRKACKEAISRYYRDSGIDLMVDRIEKRIYYSVWHVGEKLLEVTHDKQGKISIYEFLPAS